MRIWTATGIDEVWAAIGELDSVRRSFAYGTDGAVVDSEDLGGLAAGQHSFEWNAADADRSKIAGFRIKATQGGEDVSASTRTRPSLPRCR